jgi:hypothetical protein
MEDTLATLPTTNMPFEPTDLQLIEHLFPVPEPIKRNMGHILFDYRYPILTSLLFAAISLPAVHTFLGRLYGDESYMTLLLKVILFVFIVVVIHSII